MRWTWSGLILGVVLVCGVAGWAAMAPGYAEKWVEAREALSLAQRLALGLATFWNTAWPALGLLLIALPTGFGLLVDVVLKLRRRQNVR